MTTMTTKNPDTLSLISERTAMPDDRSTAKFVLLKFPCMLALATMTIAAGSTLSELSKYAPDDARVPHVMGYLFWDIITLPVVGYLFWKTCR